MRLKYPKLITHGCTAHVIDLYLKKLCGIALIQIQLDRGKEIVNYFRSHSRANALLTRTRRAHNVGSGLVPVVVTRFGTHALMLESLVKNR